MEEKKLTDEEIVKALECCSKTGACDKCPYFISRIDCVSKQRSENDALDLIHRLQEENADYKRKFEDGELVSKEWHDEQVLMLLRERDNLADYVKILKKEVDELKAENESFGKTINEASTTLRNQKAEIERLTEERKTANKHDVMYWFNAYKECVADYEEYGIKNAELQKQVDKLKEKIMNLKSAMIDRVARKSYDDLLTMPEDVEEIFGDAYESEFNKFLEQAVKDTAEKILYDLTQVLSNKEITKIELEYFVKSWAKHYGVEVE